MLTWPHAGSDWSDRLDIVNPVFAEIGAQVSRRQQLVSVCRSPAHVAQVRDILLRQQADKQRLLFVIAPSDDTWARDHGPLTTLSDGQPRVSDFVFNGWGGKFDGSRDTAITAALAAQGVFGGASVKQHDFVLEGGAIETDGAGTLLATRSTIATQTRNKGWDLAAIEDYLSRSLGFDRFLWLDHGDLSGDDTDGHIDTLARFADPETILYSTAPDGDDDSAGLAAMAGELTAMRTREGQPYRLIPLPFPGVHRDNGRRLPAGYANFLIINDAVLLPTYGVDQDADAIDVLRGAFPGREVIGIDCREIIVQNGSLHCLTMQFPAALTLHQPTETPR